MKASIPGLVITLVLLSMSGCHPRSTQSSLPEITAESEEGYHDLVFAIEDHKQSRDGSQTILASGMYKGRKVSLEVYLSAGWQTSPQDPDVPLTTYRGSVSYRSVGAESDHLLRVIDEVYGTKQSPNTMNKATEFIAISLGGDPRELAKESVKIKLFFDSNAEDRYAELFTNIDLKARKLYIREKDEEYRAAIVRALRAS